MSARHTVVDSPIGALTVIADDDLIVGLYFPQHWYLPPRESFGPRSAAGFEAVTAQLGEYFAGRRAAFDVPFTARGDGFQRRVWELISAIPYGHTTSYGELAAQLADGSTPKDVGAAVGRNPLSLLVPCHRVVGKNGALTGYAGGLRRKRFLLDLEETASTPQLARLF
ncbi:MAG TPA: methylated-DNA--[protein]-cysteine S-methyltransferase [Jatrophihabitans sp.]|nr:methylated-DNA--[protein]-cysteine S-methyltransferase [Jatrophihabitans sp.]